MRLRTKYALVLLAVIVVLGGVVLGSTELFKQQLVAEEQRELDTTTAQTAGQIEDRLNREVNDVVSLASTPGLNSSAVNPDRLDAFVDNTAYFGVQVVAPNGTVVAFRGDVDEAQRRQVIGQDLSDREYVRAPLHRGETYVRPPEHLSGAVHVVLVSVPITPPGADEPGENSGAVIGALTVGKAPEESGTSDVLGPTQTLESDVQTVEVTAPAAETDRQTALKSPSRRFEEQLTASAAIDTGINGPDWTLTVMRDRAALTGRLFVLQVIQGGGLLVVLLSMVGLGAWQYRTNLRQTERLLEGFAALTEGQFDYELSLSSAEEWKQISDGFNELGTGLREREQAIAEREKQLSVLNRVLRHNVQNDLTVVKGHAEMLPMMDDDQLETATDVITGKVDDLVAHAQKARRIEQALDLAEDGTQPVEVAGILRETMAEYAEDYPDVTVETDVPDEQHVTAIASLSFAVENVVENAFEHNSGDEQRVTGTVERTDGTVEVVVADNGPGIPDHEYEVLEQEEETALEHGSGIGLWLVYWVVEKSAGDLRFETSESGGTRVVITLAAADPEPE